MKNFGHGDLLKVEVVAIKTHLSFVHYKLLHTSDNNKKTTYYGEMILEKTKEGWKIYSVTENICK